MIRITSLALALALGLTGAQAMAQDYGNGEEGQQDPGMEQSQQPADFSDEELQQFVNLQDSIGEIREEYVSQIEAAESEDKARQLQQEAQSEMVSAIEDAGMSVQEYNAIAVAYNSNPDIQERVDEMASE
ncbi:DUF4168 domain-containing protein [Vreelandella utahensis]|uniref:DUF4168 domain-containing protein n=1 Tax=Vreelandella halophila TaxID=86177 RepID=UPI0015C37552|nr:DUF4168 domain-containing protein [Halomonas utahensis]